jgi:hypothetical protein
MGLRPLRGLLGTLREIVQAWGCADTDGYRPSQLGMEYRFVLVQPMADSFRPSLGIVVGDVASLWN